MSIIKIFKSFVGDWSITRSLGEYGMVEGIASFSYLDESTLLYKEDLDLSCFSATKAKGYKEYKYSYINDISKNKHSESLIKYFNEKERESEIFYKLDFADNNLIAHGIHKCSNDVYHAVYHFYNTKHFTLEYKILGPNKDYTISSAFSKKY